MMVEINNSSSTQALNAQDLNVTTTYSLMVIKCIVIGCISLPLIALFFTYPTSPWKLSLTRKMQYMVFYISLVISAYGFSFLKYFSIITLLSQLLTYIYRSAPGGLSPWNILKALNLRPPMASENFEYHKSYTVDETILLKERSPHFIPGSESWIMGYSSETIDAEAESVPPAHKKLITDFNLDPAFKSKNQALLTLKHMLFDSSKDRAFLPFELLGYRMQLSVLNYTTSTNESRADPQNATALTNMGLRCRLHLTVGGPYQVVLQMGVILKRSKKTLKYLIYKVPGNKLDNMSDNKRGLKDAVKIMDGSW